MPAIRKPHGFPVTAYTEGEIGHTLRELEELDLVRESWGARASKYEHRANKVWQLYSPLSGCRVRFDAERASNPG